MTMSFDAAVMNEQGINFVIINVKPEVFNNEAMSDNARTFFSKKFPGVPIVFMIRDSRGIHQYQGRPDLVQYLSKVKPEKIKWEIHQI